MMDIHNLCLKLDSIHMEYFCCARSLLPTAPSNAFVVRNQLPKCRVNSLYFGVCGAGLKCVIFRYIVGIAFMNIFSAIILMWMVRDHTDDGDDQSTNLQLIACCRLAPTRYMSNPRNTHCEIWTNTIHSFRQIQETIMIPNITSYFETSDTYLVVRMI